MDHTAHGILQARILEWAAVPFSRGRPTRSSLPVYTIPFPSLSPQKIWPASHCTFNSCFFLVTLHCGIAPNLHAHFSPVHVYFVNAPLPHCPYLSSHGDFYALLFVFALDAAQGLLRYTFVLIHCFLSAVGF